MGKFTIEMCRISYAFHTLEVEAETYDQAIKKAYEDAGDHEYSEKTAEYAIHTVNGEFTDERS